MSPAPDDVLLPASVLTFVDGRPRLRGARCAACGQVRFPAEARCLACGGADMGEILLGERGTLWTWTVQRFPPKAPPYAGPVDPARFRPFAVGYVELPGEVRVEARLTGCAFEALSFGLPMALTTEPLDPEDPDRSLAFAFTPASADAAKP